MAAVVNNKSLFGVAEEVGYFSVNSRRALHYDRSFMKYYVPRRQLNLELDLNHGYVSSQQKPHVSEKMEKVLRWIAHNDFEVLHSETGSALDFVTKRGTLQEVMCSPYYHFPSDAWSVCATKLEDTIYFCAVDTDYEIIQKANRSERQKLMSFWGYKFEQYVTAKEPDGTPDMKNTSFQEESFEIVVKNNIGNYNVLFEAEVDAIKNGQAPGTTSSYLELKTNRNSPPYLSDRSFLRNKTLKWWAQTHVAGVKEVICGFRNNDGIVRSIETFKVNSLPQLGKGYWNPDECMDYCYDFLKSLKRQVKEDDYRVVYKFDFDGTGMYLTKMADPEQRCQIVPEWYATALKNSHD